MIRLILILTIGYISIFPTYSQSNNDIFAGKFSDENINSITPNHWQPLKFDGIDNQTAYFLTHDNQNVILKAVSHSSASGYLRKISIDPKDYPYLSWRWKVDNLIEKANIKTKEGDDYPARVYITFEYDLTRLSGWESFKVELYKSVHGEYPPLAALNYVWDNKQPIGFTTPNAYTERVQMLVAQSGKKHVGQWVEQKVNILEDYKRVFGETPMKITAVAIMTDTDNTKESATAYYGDIKFTKK